MKAFIYREWFRYQTRAMKQNYNNQNCKFEVKERNNLSSLTTELFAFPYIVFDCCSLFFPCSSESWQFSEKLSAISFLKQITHIAITRKKIIQNVMNAEDLFFDMQYSFLFFFCLVTLKINRFFCLSLLLIFCDDKKKITDSHRDSQ